LPNDAHNFLDVDRGLRIPVVARILSQIGIQEFKHRTRQVREIPSDLAQGVDGAKSHLELGITELSDSTIEEFRNVLSSRQLSLPQRSISLLIGCRYPKPSQIQTKGATQEQPALLRMSRS